MAFYTTALDYFTGERPKFPTFYLFIDSDDDELINKYKTKMENHNMMINENKYPDSGFDLFIPQEFSGEYLKNSRTKVDYKVVGVMKDQDQYLPYYIYPRSSISKTPLQLCNNVGIIDCGYRGHLMSYFANHGTILSTTNNNLEIQPETYTVEPYTRLTQVCSPTLKPFYVEIVHSMDEFTKSERSSGGFGSTGI
jgi:dUTP pyrophosphatase